jgi:hypothetical protein
MPDLAELGADGALCDLGVIRSLRTKPISVGQAKETAETKISVSRDGPPAGHNVSDALRRDRNFLGQAVLRDAHGLQELLRKKFTGGDGAELAHICLS